MSQTAEELLYDLIAYTCGLCGDQTNFVNNPADARTQLMTHYLSAHSVREDAVKVLIYQKMRSDSGRYPTSPALEISPSVICTLCGGGGSLRVRTSAKGKTYVLRCTRCHGRGRVS